MQQQNFFATQNSLYGMKRNDRTLRDIIKTDKLLGGIVLLLAGDFRQILPVVRLGRRADIVDTALSRSALWQRSVLSYSSIVTCASRDSVVRRNTPLNYVSMQTGCYIFVSPGDAPGAITLNVVWMEREFHAYKLSRCMCPSNYNPFWDTAR